MLDQENIQKEQEITSLRHKNQVLESELEKIDERYKDAKQAASDSADHSTQSEATQRRVRLLENENEESEKNLRETIEKCAPILQYMVWQTSRH